MLCRKNIMHKNGKIHHEALKLVMHLMMTFLSLTKNIQSWTPASKKLVLFCFHESPLKVMKNYFCTILKFLFRSQDIEIFVLTFQTLEFQIFTKSAVDSVQSTIFYDIFRSLICYLNLCTI